MISPQKNNNGAASPRTSVPLRGLFRDVYTCQRPQQQRCNFFLWATDAEAREKLAILSNSRTEPQNMPQTPTKASRHEGTGLLTPQTDRPLRHAPGSESRNFQTPSKSAKARMMTEDSDGFEWDDTIADEAATVQHKPRQPDFGQAAGGSDFLPRKTPRTDSFTSPSKRKLSDMESAPSLTPTSVFSPRSTACRLPPASAEISVTPTPSKYKNALSADSAADTSELSLQALRILESHNVVVPRKAQEELTELLNRYDLKTRGIIRGRDISRFAIKKKDEEIMKLNERIVVLESQRELSKSMANGSGRQ
ncbi:hypothetical protein ANOM_008167 [Aspergillus nomiae NRRL 13137]|uniref:Zinc finger GRF-type domain-containing protein n=1 Tax=Aspergillus nomiae NRRL (strain ATCC 15546 / NRRL 13137 / CBS 260.88 / M93) TaxID=1509407 RepID=A0A0L1IYW6_ASPN3|nr:uncharacterized protein ANOM_008167 [Aspergillus nomiae NRRL 13137]KNG84358.1 hypothetical protein ANOM_008167 [Aspergillus nomiae NRRL 13137]